MRIMWRPVPLDPKSHREDKEVAQADAQQRELASQLLEEGDSVFLKLDNNQSYPSLQRGLLYHPKPFAI